MSDRVQRIFDQMGSSMPLEIGHDRRASGYRSTINASPIPALNRVVTPIPLPTAGYSFDDVLTRSAIPHFAAEQSQYPTLVATLPMLSGSQPAEPGIPTETSEEQPAEEPEEESGCTGPQKLCPPELNQIIYRILTSEVQPQINCPGDRLDLYQTGEPMEADFTYKADYEFIYREAGQTQFVASPMVKLRYSQWGPPSSSSQSGKPVVRLLLLHDALDSRKGWWCCQRLLSPFLDTMSVDLLGSGQSTKPRGINIPSSESSSGKEGATTTEVVPWSYEFHAQYLIDMVKIIWPTEKIYVAGVGWGAQIAVTMASLSDVIAGVIMINPPGLSRTVHPELSYLGIYHLARIQSDDLLESSHVSIIHLIRETLLRNLKNHQSPLNLILDQYCSLDRKRILIDQIVSVAEFRYQELPRTDENVYGLQIENVKVPVLVIASDQDEVYPADCSNLFPAVYYNAVVRVERLSKTGHFAQLDNPEKVAEMLLDFIRQDVGVGRLKSVFVGFGAIGQPNEKQMVAEFSDLYEI